MDQQKLRTLVFEKTGVKIDVDDPVFALVALNEAVLAEAVERHVALLDDATAELAGRLRDSGISVSSASSASLSTPAAAAAAPVTAEKRTIAIAGAAALLGAVLVLLGQALLFRPAPAPIVQTKELSDEQASALRNGEKLARIVQKLDAKTRDKIQAELQKP
ncbi:hypothetical protein CR105_04270 [Massilia eurypsychrophila]|jgi:hypothetical protein|uniref:Uncharacterized protein n=1 Tax=Massilia eurypsychrophila TaxID=1485217 RepID=A0A2G8TJS7_9BURK|nr:hypothetical protein [Massilia eurypsychrophila]PIL46305.1 hypothetical protein CR105_04270 [Massilia eurypsychrophila]